MSILHLKITVAQIQLYQQGAQLMNYPIKDDMVHKNGGEGWMGNGKM